MGSNVNCATSSPGVCSRHIPRPLVLEPEMVTREAWAMLHGTYLGHRAEAGDAHARGLGHAVLREQLLEDVAEDAVAVEPGGIGLR
eukprot:8255646-Pyramimonas_sp.AAC.1